ncbi:hypothetical protein PS1_019614 [Malus domestica]
MTRSCHPIYEHILDFNDDFERTLRRNRNQQDRNPLIPEPEFEEHLLEEKEEDPNIVADNRTIKELSASGIGQCRSPMHPIPPGCPREDGRVRIEIKFVASHS